MSIINYQDSNGVWRVLSTSQGVLGIRGEKGSDGEDLKVLGAKATVGELPSTGNAQGDAWLVSGDLYIWSGTAWVNAGPLQGDKGDQGDQGPQGIQGEQGEQGIQGNIGLTGD